MIKCLGKKRTAKQYVAERLLLDLDCLTDYYYERHKEEYNAMTEKEQLEVRVRFDEFHNRIVKILEKSVKK